jgi:DNA-binding CsgD family transcriptional regulator
VNYLVSYGLASFAQIENKPLTARQREIFDLIVIGLSNKEIARKLGLSVSTVKIHVAAVFRKLGVHHRSAVALAGVKFGLRPWPMLLSVGFDDDTTANCGSNKERNLRKASWLFAVNRSGE